MNIFKLLLLLKEIIELLKDTDKDGRPDLFDRHPNDPERK